METQPIEKITHKYFVTYFYKDSVPLDKDVNNYSNLSRTKSGKWEFSHEDFSEESFVKNYGNPIASVESILTTFVIEKIGDKLSLKIYTNRKKRVRGSKFFVKRRSVRYLTINTKTYDIYTGIFSKNRKLPKTIARNNYIKTKNFIGFVNIFFCDCKISQIDSRFDNFKDLNDLILKIFRKELNENNINDYGDIFHWRMKNIGLKYSDNHEIFFKDNNHFTLKNIRKGSFKMIESVMSYYNYEGKKIRSVLNQVKRFDPRGWEITNILFDDPINEFSREMIMKIFEYPNNSWYASSPYNDFKNWKQLSNKEKKCLKTIFEITIKEERSMGSLMDHLWFREQLITNYGHIVEFKSNTMKEFNEQHYDWTNELDFYKVGVYYREYNKKFKENLNQTIYGYDGIQYHINLLETSADYIEESIVQNNCVRTYQDRNSIIVSIRIGNKNSDERASVEYRLFQKNGQTELKRIQSLGKYNSNLGDSWNDILKQTDKIFENSMEYLKQDVYLYYKTKKSTNKYEFKPSINGEFEFTKIG